MSKTVVTMWLCVVGMVLGASVPGWAAPMGTAFVYQGSLKDGGSPANDSYNFKFYLYDASAGGSLLGTETKNGVVLLDGYLTSNWISAVFTSMAATVGWISGWMTAQPDLPSSCRVRN